MPDLREPCHVLCPWQWWALGLLALQLALIAAVMLFYNLTYIQPQGRYLFGAMAAISIFFVLGLREMIDRPLLMPALTAAGCGALFLFGGGKLFLALGGGVAVIVLALWYRGRRWYRPVVWLGLAGGLVFLDVICLAWFIVPALAV